uniref:CRISPR system Cms endoribonuclease Csm3 n=1 Tax=candidate division WOR-3 bacterium TaxID=2052148 RepID=A0A7C4GGJ6_UNCW3
MAFLLGKVIVSGRIRLVSGTRVGGSQGGLKIGGVDLNVITDPQGRPYLPGSSLKGKLRSLTERVLEASVSDRGMHTCGKKDEYAKCDVCRTYGTLKSFEGVPTLTRLVARDVFLDESSITEEMRANMDMEFTEVKFETAIDRVSGTALKRSLRQVERVPAGAVFRPAEFVFNVYEENDKGLLRCLFVAMELLEDDYLGGMGSRGYGKVKFEDISVWWNRATDYQDGKVALSECRRINGEMKTPTALVQGFDTLKAKLT